MENIQFNLVQTQHHEDLSVHVALEPIVLLNWGGSRGGAAEAWPPTPKNEAPAPKFYKIGAIE